MARLATAEKVQGSTVSNRPSWLTFWICVLMSYNLGRLSSDPTFVAAAIQVLKVSNAVPETSTEASTQDSATDPPNQVSSVDVWKVLPMEHTDHVEFFPGYTTDAFNPFHNYISQFNRHKGVDFPELPAFDTWFHYLEAYHNHFHRFRKQKKVVFMEVGVQSGGKIALLRDYFGPGFTYIGMDVNPSTKMFDNGEWAHVEIGNSEDRNFLKKIKEKYPHVDIFLDDGGHTMSQQRTAMEEMIPHVQPEGIYVVEDLSTSWNPFMYGGLRNMDMRDEQFREKTTFGLIHRSLDWFMSDWITGKRQTKPDRVASDYFDESWWQTVPDTVKHIHFYNGIVIYEKGLTFIPQNHMTIGKNIPYRDTGTHPPVDWPPIMKKIQTFTNSPWE